MSRLLVLWEACHTMMYSSQSVNRGCWDSEKGNCCTLQHSKHNSAFRISLPDAAMMRAASGSGRDSSSCPEIFIMTSIIDVC